MALNESYPFRKPGREVTATAGAAITGKRFVSVSANPTKIGDNPTVQHTAAAAKPYGVAAFDAASGSTELLVHTGHGLEVPITASGTIAFGTEVESAANGMCRTLASGRPAGYALSSAADGADVRVKLY